MTAAPLLTLAGATVRFGAVVALREVDLTLHRGDRLALVGANGSGKTTLLRLLHGLLACEGRRELHALAPHGRAPVVAMLFQRPFLLHLSVRRNLQLALWLGGVPRRERAGRIDAALARVGLQGLEARPARALSGGQQQRLALARAWVLRPDILFLDEPTASLDPAAAKSVEAILRDIAASGIKIVMATHDLGLARRLADDILFIARGRLVESAPARQFFEAPATEQGAQFLRGDLVL